MNGNRKSSLGLGLLLIALVALGGCSGLKRSDFTLLTRSSDQQIHVAQQQWLVQQGQQEYTLEVIVERSADHWRWIMLSQLGQRVATVESLNGQVQIERHQSHAAMQWLPELLQAWQFSYWPLADLQTADPRWQFVERDGRREASFSGILRASIEYQQITDRANPWQGSLGYVTREFSLRIHSQPLN
ncbi:DUF3261 domain-containing protein [Cellvibrio sp. OA-2007]|uniref:DUF3261 domain-containing protein n=1 Tax=Cellvibrio sp. OA-2007 TaxID=529823 RepID=UPI000782F058|nr:DUF3261 domain-containing protein [Cellvibrio sp. OA-2007]